MTIMKILTFKFQSWIFLAVILLCSQAVLAVPTFQVYIEGATAGTIGEDENTWFTTSSSFNVVVVGAYGPKTDLLTQVTLALSVPQGQTGAISITGGDIGATLLKTKELVPGTSFYNPNANADVDLLTDVSGIDGYLTKNFLPDDQHVASEHYPFKEDVSDFLIYGIGEFHPLGDIHDYNADDGSTSLISGSYGEEKNFSVSVTGFSRVHFDAYGYELIDNGKVFRSNWESNPSSHDSTYYIPAPGAVVLAGMGVGLVGWLRRRRTL